MLYYTGMNLPPCEEVAQSLSHINSLYDASGCHGLLCGILVVDFTTPMSVWVEELAGEEIASVGSSLMQDKAFVDLYDACRSQLQDTNLGLELLLPYDTASIEERIKALSSWCQSFVLGLSLAGIGKKARLPADTAELIDDFSQISQAAYNENEGSGNEIAYMELVEFIKVGTLLINEELQPIRSASSTTQ